jgi:hypothetical protein
MPRHRLLAELGGGVGTCLLGLALATAGCGSEGTPAGPGAAFVGSWLYGQATGSLTCADGAIDETPGGNKELATGVEDGTVVDLSRSVLDSAINCDFAFDVKGPVATARTDQTCAMTGGLDVLSFKPASDTKPKDDAWTFTLLSPTTAEEVVQMTLTMTTPSPDIGGQPTSVDCLLEIAAHLRRVSKD